MPLNLRFRLKIIQKKKSILGKKEHFLLVVIHSYEERIYMNGWIDGWMGGQTDTYNLLSYYVIIYTTAF